MESRSVMTVGYSMLQRSDDTLNVDSIISLQRCEIRERVCLQVSAAAVVNVDEMRFLGAGRALG